MGVSYAGLEKKGSMINQIRRRYLHSLTCSPPQSKTEVRAFLWLICQFKHWSPNISFLSKPMRALTHQHTHFKWTQECDEEFQMMKEVVGSIQFLPPLDIRKELEIITDASKEGRFRVCPQPTRTGQDQGSDTIRVHIAHLCPNQL